MADGKAGHEKAEHEKSDRAFRTIGEVSELLDLPQHVLRFWETRFTHIRPLKRGGNRRYYRPADIDLLCAIKTLLYEEGITIKGVQKRFREQGVRVTVMSVLEASRADEGAELADKVAEKDAGQDSDHGYPEKAVSATCEDASSGEDGQSDNTGLISRFPVPHPACLSKLLNRTILRRLACRKKRLVTFWPSFGN
ncbi:hypothetical protein JCM17844_17400 [Iodidimonas gelatinilytica]|uniref:HTH merR-type domain-containing protein n=1 Tax=Iodidimonas gelatinilytica TaxID=1236966 RepID=A0A5A7MSB4_9PROT|nr:hypothetical protein JCM17844_17400 [Iodidimonas gelatinilytica]GER00717.1 hypothetical protein JCM17845_13400 [Iodidimonas gelatinilytica]